jgi:hypothetical protein
MPTPPKLVEVALIEPGPARLQPVLGQPGGWERPSDMHLPPPRVGGGTGQMAPAGAALSYPCPPTPAGTPPPFCYEDCHLHRGWARTAFMSQDWVPVHHATPGQSIRLWNLPRPAGTGIVDGG